MQRSDSIRWIQHVGYDFHWKEYHTIHGVSDIQNQRQFVRITEIAVLSFDSPETVQRQHIQNASHQGEREIDGQHKNI